MSNLQSNNNTKNEEKVREDEQQLNHAQIQSQIQEAIFLFQEEWGPELDAGLGNIDSFKYEVFPSEPSSLATPPIDLAVEDMVFPANKEKEKEKEEEEVETGAFGVDFRIKFTDANSNKKQVEDMDQDDDTETKQTETQTETDTDGKKGEFLEDPTTDDEDALPDSFYTAGLFFLLV